MRSSDLTHPGRLRGRGTTRPPGEALRGADRRPPTLSRQGTVIGAADPRSTASAKTDESADPAIWIACTCARDRLTPSLPMPDAGDVGLPAIGHTSHHSLYHPDDVIHGLPDTFTKDHRSRPAAIVSLVVSHPAVHSINGRRRDGPVRSRR